MHMYYLDINHENIFEFSIANHKIFCDISTTIIAKMKLDNNSSCEDYFKLKCCTSIYVNDEIKKINDRDINEIISNYGFDNAIKKYKKHYRILDNITARMLLYNIIYNYYIIIIDLVKKNAVNKLQSYIIANKNRKKYIKKANIKRESNYLIDKINTEIKCDDAKVIIINIINKFINKTMKSLDKA